MALFHDNSRLIVMIILLLSIIFQFSASCHLTIPLSFIVFPHFVLSFIVLHCTVYFITHSHCALFHSIFIQVGDPPRVWDESLERPGCAFTRSLGDSVAEACGVCAEPEVRRTCSTVCAVTLYFESIFFISILCTVLNFKRR